MDFSMMALGSAVQMKGLGLSPASRPLSLKNQPGNTRPRRIPSAQVLPKLSAEDRQLPLYRLLDRMNDETVDPKYRDFLAIACLPYVHARVPTPMVVKSVHMMTDHH